MSTEPRQTPEEAKKAFDRTTALNRLGEQKEIAIRVLPAFRDKFDFSNPAEDYPKLADMAYQAADAVLRKHAAMVAALEVSK